MTKEQVEEVQSALNNISGLINEREEHLAHIERLQELNTRLLKEAQSISEYSKARLKGTDAREPTYIL